MPDNDLKVHRHDPSSALANGGDYCVMAKAGPILGGRRLRSLAGQRCRNAASGPLSLAAVQIPDKALSPTAVALPGPPGSLHTGHCLEEVLTAGRLPQIGTSPTPTLTLCKQLLMTG